MPAAVVHRRDLAPRSVCAAVPQYLTPIGTDVSEGRAKTAAFLARLRAYGVLLPATHPQLRSAVPAATPPQTGMRQTEMSKASLSTRTSIAPPSGGYCGLLPPLNDAYREEFEGKTTERRGVDSGPPAAMLRVVGVLGRGACGEVLLAQGLEAPYYFCALKRFPRPNEGDPMGTMGARGEWLRSRGLDAEDLEVDGAGPLNAMATFEVEWRIARHLHRHQKQAGVRGVEAAHHHRHIVRTIGAYPTVHAQHIALELAALGSLTQYSSCTTADATQVAHHPAPIDALGCTRLLMHALHGLCCLHDCGVLHRDIKPDNMLIRCAPAGLDQCNPSVCSMSHTAHVELFLGDFGVSKLLAASPASGGQHRGSIGDEADHTVVGTLAFTAPEVMEHWGSSPRAAYSEAADVFSLGAVFYCWMARGTLAGGGGLVRGPQDANRLLQGMLPTLTDLCTFAQTHTEPPPPADSGYDAPWGCRGGAEDTTTATTTVSVSASLVLQRQEAVWRSEGQRLVAFPAAVLACVDAMMQLDATRRPSAADALQRIIAALLSGLESGATPQLPLGVPDLGLPMVETSLTAPRGPSLFGVLGAIVAADAHHHGRPPPSIRGVGPWWHVTGLPMPLGPLFHGTDESMFHGTSHAMMDVAGHSRSGCLAWRVSLLRRSFAVDAHRDWCALASALSDALDRAFGAPIVLLSSGSTTTAASHPPATGALCEAIVFTCQRVPCLPPGDVVGRTAEATMRALKASCG